MVCNKNFYIYVATNLWQKYTLSILFLCINSLPFATFTQIYWPHTTNELNIHNDQEVSTKFETFIYYMIFSLYHHKKGSWSFYHTGALTHSISFVKTDSWFIGLSISKNKISLLNWMRWVNPIPSAAKQALKPKPSAK